MMDVDRVTALLERKARLCLNPRRLGCRIMGRGLAEVSASKGVFDGKLAALEPCLRLGFSCAH